MKEMREAGSFQLLNGIHERTIAKSLSIPGRQGDGPTLSNSEKDKVAEQL